MSKKRLLLYGINYHPELIGIGKYTGEMAAWMQRNGFDVRVVTAPPYYPDWRVSNEYHSCRYTREEIDGVGVWRCPLYVPREPSGLKRLLHLFSFMLSSFPVMLRQVFWKPDIVMMIEPPFFCAPAALLTTRLAGARSWLHVQDLELDAAFNLGLLPNSLRPFAMALERFILRRFDWLSTISNRMQEMLAAKGISQDRITFFPNWVDIDRIYPLPAQASLRAELDIKQDAFVLLYSGNIGEKQGIGQIIAAARHIQHQKDIVFMLCGTGAAYQRTRAHSRGLNNVRWLPLQPLETFNALLNTADAHLLPERADASGLVMPSKLLGMLASAIPIISTAKPGSQLAAIIQQAGLLVPQDDPQAFAAAIERLRTNEDLRRQLGASGLAYCKHHFAKPVVLSRIRDRLLHII